MSNKYILAIDQSTQGTKALLFNKEGKILGRYDIAHKQIINEKGWVEHDPEQIYNNTVEAVKNLLQKTGVNSSDIAGAGLTNQRETAVIWDKVTGAPVYNAIVWQCARGASICEERKEYQKEVQLRTGLNLSPYFTAAKIAWVLQNVPGAREKSDNGRLAYGTMDSWLVYKLTGNFKTDYSNASRTQLFNISELTWDSKICELFGINTECLAPVCYSDSFFGETDFGGVLHKKIPIHSVLGDSHAALYGQYCHKRGMIKATYGTGSSIMMNIGEKPVFCKNGIVTSLAWGIHNKIDYVLEGNINYSGAVISWLKNDLKIITNTSDTEQLAYEANPSDTTYLVPAFTGLGAPYWKSNAKALITGMSRTTGRAELVRAALDSIAYQISDIVNLMSQESGIMIQELRVDGGPTKNQYLMQFQSDILNRMVSVPQIEELSAAGAAYLAGSAIGMYDIDLIHEGTVYNRYTTGMQEEKRFSKYSGWKNALQMVLDDNSDLSMNSQR